MLKTKRLLTILVTLFILYLTVPSTLAQKGVHSGSSGNSKVNASRSNFQKLAHGQRHRRRSSSRRTGRYYNNVDGLKVHSPMHSRSKPSGASAVCRDGTYSFSRHARGTCSHHGGVARWL